MISLYDYLGRAAGPELGKRVASAAAAKTSPLIHVMLKLSHTQVKFYYFYEM